MWFSLGFGHVFQPCRLWQSINALALLLISPGAGSGLDFRAPCFGHSLHLQSTYAEESYHPWWLCAHYSWEDRNLFFLSYRWEAEVQKKTEADISNNLCSSVPTDFSECPCKCYFMCTLTFWNLAGTMFLLTLSFKNEICSLTSLYTKREKYS